MAEPRSQPSEEPDLGALVARVLPRLAELEGPILQSAGLSMWEYAIVTELAGGGVVSQAELARRVRRDPTRLGRHLDELETRQLIMRAPGADKRQRSMRLTDAGYNTFRQARHEIRKVEDALLSQALTPAQAVNFRQQLRRLADACNSKE